MQTQQRGHTGSLVASAHRGTRSGPSTWTKLEKIDKCPLHKAHSSTDVFGRKLECKCGWHLKKVSEFIQKTIRPFKGVGQSVRWQKRLSQTQSVCHMNASRLGPSPIGPGQLGPPPVD